MKTLSNKIMQSLCSKYICTLNPSMLVLFIVVFISIAQFSHANDFKSWHVQKTGNKVVYTPLNLKQGEQYNITLFSAQNISRTTHANWLSSFVANDEKNLGTITYRGEISQHKLGMLGIARKFKNAIGKKWNMLGNRHKPIFASQFALYLSQKISDTQATIMRVNYSNQDIFKRYQYGLREVGKIINTQGDHGYLKQKLTTHNKEKQRLAEIERKKIAGKKQAEVAKERAKSLKRTAPNKGLNSQQIEAILINNDIDVLMGGFDTTIHLLLKDGWVYKLGSGGAEIPPADFDADYSKKYEPNRWSKWRKNTKMEYEKINKQGQWKAIGGSKGIAGNKNETVNGNYGMHAGSSFFGSSSSYVKLFKNNRFELSSNILVSTNSIDGDYNITTFSGSNKDGTDTVSSGNSPGAVVGSSNKKKDGAKNRGTYKIDGYTIERHFDNGVVRRDLFFFGSSDKSSIVIDDNYYWISKK